MPTRLLAQGKSQEPPASGQPVSLATVKVTKRQASRAVSLPVLVLGAVCAHRWCRLQVPRRAQLYWEGKRPGGEVSIAPGSHRCQSDCDHAS